MVSRAVEPAVPLDRWHDERVGSTHPRVEADVRRAILALAELVGQLHNAGVLHHDLHTGNVLLQDDGPRMRLTLMDLHRVGRRRRPSRRALARNLAQLLHDRRHVTTRSGRLAFLKRYLQVARVSGTLRGWQLMVEGFADAHTRRLYRGRDRRVFEDN
jgi:Ser/Thr protein kinase RdoA (MazF antagonist)